MSAFAEKQRLIPGASRQKKALYLRLRLNQLLKNITTGEKTAYTLKHTDTGLVEEFSKLEDIPKEVRDYFKRLTKPKFCGPDLSHILGLNSVFYPDWPKKCGHPDYQGKRCVAESCKFAEEAGGWEKCPYFTGERLEALE